MSSQQYNITLSPAEVDGYWRYIDMSQEAWMKLSKTQRAKIAWDDMFAKQRAAHEAAEAARQLSE
jgi:hypothetical protein